MYNIIFIIIFNIVGRNLNLELSFQSLIQTCKLCLFSKDWQCLHFPVALSFNMAESYFYFVEMRFVCLHPRRYCLISVYGISGGTV